VLCLTLTEFGLLPSKIKQSCCKLIILPAGSTWYLLCHDEPGDDPALEAAVCNNRYALNSDICSLHDSLTIVQHCLYSLTFWLVPLTVIAMLYCHILVICCGRLHRCHCAMLGCLRISACGFKPLAYTSHVQIKQMIVAGFCLQDECTTIISRELMQTYCHVYTTTWDIRKCAECMQCSTLRHKHD